MTLRKRASKYSWLFRMRGRGTAASCFLVRPSDSGISRSILPKLAGSSGWSRLAIRNRVHVFPDFGNDTMNVSSSNTSNSRPGLVCPSTRFVVLMRRLIIAVRSPNHVPCCERTRHGGSITGKNHFPRLAGYAWGSSHQQSKQARLEGTAWIAGHELISQARHDVTPRGLDARQSRLGQIASPAAGLRHRPHLFVRTALYGLRDSLGRCRQSREFSHPR